MASETRTLRSAPAILPLYARAAAPLVPGLSLLPFVPGGGGEIPEVELELPGVRADPEAVAAYARVCGFTLRDRLPPTYPHVLAFPLHMALMADGRFPFGAVGLVHVENRIEQRRPLALGEELTLRARPTPLVPHPKGRSFTIVSEARGAGGELAWKGVSTFLRRGHGDPDAVVPAMRGQSGHGDSDAVVPAMRGQLDRGGGAEPGGGGARDAGGAADAADLALDPEAPASAEWRLGGDLGRRYAAVSGDRNPIHLHALTARPLGFPAAIAHGMWTKARCLAALEPRLPDAFAVTVRFRKPILLPARVELVSAAAGGGGAGELVDAAAAEGAAGTATAIEFAVRDARKATPHLDGRLTAAPVGSKSDAAAPGAPKSEAAAPDAAAAPRARRKAKKPKQSGGKK